MAVNYAKNRQTLKKARDLYINRDHEAFRETKPKSYYPFGRKKGASFTRTQAFCENYDAIFGKKEVATDDDLGSDPASGT